ncbi:MAG: cytochrome c biogenesis CcdA family protein [Candidatus Limnocylindria bacterium]
MTDGISIALAFAAGVLSFISPCVLALLPVYLAFLGDAATVAETGPTTTATRSAVLPQALLFIGGFSAVFILLGTSLGLVGAPLFGVPGVREVAGVLVIVLGVLTTGVFGPVLDRLRIGPDPNSLPATRSTRAFALGALVAVGWTPCIGPVLGAILTMGASSGSAPVVALLLTAYSAGVALPFIVTALAFPRMRPLIGFLRRHHAAVRVMSGVFIIAIGVLIYLNAFARLATLFTFIL